MNGLDIGVWRATLFQLSIKRTAALNRNHSGKAMSELLGPKTDTTTKVENRAFPIYTAEQPRNQSGFRLETKITGADGETEAIHHIRPEDRGRDVFPIPAN